MDTYGLPVREIMRLAGVTERSARRWKRAGRIPAPYSTMVALRWNADLGVLSAAWDGWRLSQDQLWSPEGVAFEPAAIRAIPWQTQALTAYRLERGRSQLDKAVAREVHEQLDDLLNVLRTLYTPLQNAERFLTRLKDSARRPPLPPTSIDDAAPIPAPALRAATGLRPHGDCGGPPSTESLDRLGLSSG